VATPAASAALPRHWHGVVSGHFERNRTDGNVTEHTTINERYEWHGALAVHGTLVARGHYRLRQGRRNVARLPLTSAGRRIARRAGAHLTLVVAAVRAGAAPVVRRHRLR
jgi:hypothetical protein